MQEIKFAIMGNKDHADEIKRHLKKIHPDSQVSLSYDVNRYVYCIRINNSVYVTDVISFKRKYPDVKIHTYKDIINTNKTMKKSDLKTGMSVKTRNGRHYLVVKLDEPTVVKFSTCPQTLIFINSGAEAGQMPGDDFTEDLKGEFGNGWDIIGVYEYASNGLSYKSFDISSHDRCIWSEVEEMTLEQVCEELGREIKIIK